VLKLVVGILYTHSLSARAKSNDRPTTNMQIAICITSDDIVYNYNERLQNDFSTITKPKS
jgi:hypothetical protein